MFSSAQRWNVSIRTLASRALGIYQSRNNDNYASKRVIIALSGPSGSRKSTIANALVTRLNSQTTESLAITLPTDGFHYSKAYLNSLLNREESYHTAAHAGLPTQPEYCNWSKPFISARLTYKGGFIWAAIWPCSRGSCWKRYMCIPRYFDYNPRRQLPVL